MDRGDSFFIKFWIVLLHYRVYSILLENFNMPIQSDLIMCFNQRWQESGNWVSRNFAYIAIDSYESRFYAFELQAKEAYIGYPKSKTEPFVIIAVSSVHPETFGAKSSIIDVLR